MSALPPILGKFEMASICPHAAVLLIGRRSSGKKTLARDILLHRRDGDDVPFASVTVVSPTEHIHRVFGDVATPARTVRIHGEYAPEIVDAIVDAIERKQGGRAFVVIEDCMYDSRWLTDEGTERLVKDRRSLEVTAVLAIPFPPGMPPSLEEQFDYVFIMHDTVASNRKRLYEHYGSEAFPTFDAFCQAMDRCSEENVRLVIDRTGSAARASWYKADLCSA